MIVPLVLALLALAVAPAAAKDRILAAAKPDKLIVIDAGARKVEKTLTIPKAAPGPGSIVPSPDGKVAYLQVAGYAAVSGVDLESGREVFRANFDEDPTLRVKSVFAMDVTPDGKELHVYQSPVRIHRDRYEVQGTRIAVYRTADGVGAKPVRTYPAPRRISVLAFSPDGAKLYAVSWDIVVLDPKTGSVLETLGVRNWKRPNFGEPDVFAAWPLWEQTNVFASPYFAVRTDRKPADPGAFRTGLLTLDLASGKLVMEEFEDTSAVIFSAVVNPARPNEVFMVYTTLTKVDREKKEIVKRIELEHTYYAVNISSDGEELYLGGTMDDVAVYSTKTLERLATIKIPGGADQGIAPIRVVRR